MSIDLGALEPWQQYGYLAYQAEILGHYQLSDMILRECPGRGERRDYLPTFRDKLVARRECGEPPRHVSIELLTD